MCAFNHDICAKVSGAFGEIVAKTEMRSVSRVDDKYGLIFMNDLGYGLNIRNNPFVGRGGYNNRLCAAFFLGFGYRGGLNLAKTSESRL